MAELPQWLVAVVEVIEEIARPSSKAERQRGLDRSMAVDRERLVREAEVADGRRASVWGSQR